MPDGINPSTLHRCLAGKGSATILTNGGAEAEALEECANPISAMTRGEAKTIADLLR